MVYPFMVWDILPRNNQPLSPLLHLLSTNSLPFEKYRFHTWQNVLSVGLLCTLLTLYSLSIMFWQDTYSTVIFIKLKTNEFNCSKSHLYMTFPHQNTKCWNLFTQTDMKDCVIICDVILIEFQLKLISSFFFLLSKAIATCHKMWSLSCYCTSWLDYTSSLHTCYTCYERKQ